MEIAEFSTKAARIVHLSGKPQMVGTPISKPHHAYNKVDLIVDFCAMCLKAKIVHSRCSVNGDYLSS